MTATPPIIRAVIDGLNACLDEEAIIKELRHGRGFTAPERAAWSWIDDAMETPSFRTALIGVDRSTRRWLESLLSDYAAAVHPDERPESETQLQLFDKQAMVIIHLAHH